MLKWAHNPILRPGGGDDVVSADNISLASSLGEDSDQISTLKKTKKRKTKRSNSTEKLLSSGTIKRSNTNLKPSPRFVQYGIEFLYLHIFHPLYYDF